MLKAFRSHKFYVPLITILGSVGLFLIYYFFYVAGQRRYADDRAFRLLSTAGEQTAKEIENLPSILAASLRSGPDPAAYLKRIFRDQIYNTRPGGANLEDPEQLTREGALRLSWLNRLNHFTLGADYRVGEFPQPPAVASKEATPPKPVRFCDHGPSTPGVCVEISMDTRLRERFHNVTEEYFDDILIATPSGNVLFQENNSGLRITSLNALLLARAKAANPQPATPATPPKNDHSVNEFQETSQFSNVQTVPLGGTEYRLYMQPLRMEIMDLDGQNLKPVLCGLWRADRLQSEAVSLPYPVLIWCALVLLSAVALVWPLLKVKYMSASERLRRRHVFYLICSSLLVASLLTMVVLNAAYSLRDAEESEEQLKFLAKQIDRNVRDELNHALHFMNVLSTDHVFLSTAFEKKSKNYWIGRNFLGSHFFERQPSPEVYYPYLDSVSWVNESGHQQYKLTVHADAPPAPVGDRDYFQDVLHSTNLIHGWDSQFRFDSVFSRNTGEYFVVLARPSEPSTSWTDPAAAGNLKAQVLAAKFLSLVDPVVPEGLGFAVVDHDGIVQFHSASSRNQVEDFFAECRQDPALKALIVNGGSDLLTVNYKARRHDMFVMQLPYLGIPAPTLVVFRDTNYFSTIRVACLLVFTLLAGVFSLPCLIVLSICVFRPSHYPLANLWPDKGQVPWYLAIISANLIMSAAFAIRFPWMKMDEMLVEILAMSGVAIVACVSPKQKMSERLEPWVKRHAGLDRLVELAKLKSEHIYLATAFSLLTVLVVLPCFGLFKISYNTVNRLSLQNAQLARRDQLIRRADKIRADEIREGGASVAGRLNQQWDRYDNPSFYPKDPPSPSDPRAEPPLKKERVPSDVSRLEKWTAQASGFFPINRLGAELRETSRSGEGKWKSADDGDDELLWLQGIQAGVAPAQPQIALQDELSGVYPLWQFRWETVLFLMLPLAILLVFWLRYVIRKVFLTDLGHVPPLEIWTPRRAETRNLLILDHPKSGKAATLRREMPDIDMLDIAKMAAMHDWKLGPLKHKTTVVNHFEFDMDNPETSTHKLALLEKLLYSERKCVLLLTAVDPMFYLSAGGPSGPDHAPRAQELDRWAAVLSLFQKCTMKDVMEVRFTKRIRDVKRPEELKKAIKRECDHTAHLRRIGLSMLEAHRGPEFSEGPFMEELHDRTDSYYRVLWATCSKEERLALFQLAEDGWVNPQNDRAIQELERRGIISKQSGFRIMNESFARFVRRAQSPEEILKWEENQQDSVWSMLRLGLGTALMMFGAWLLYAQQDAFQIGIGYIAALGTAGGAVTSLVRSITGTRGGSAGAVK